MVRHTFKITLKTWSSNFCASSKSLCCPRGGITLLQMAEEGTVERWLLSLTASYRDYKASNEVKVLVYCLRSAYGWIFALPSNCTPWYLSSIQIPAVYNCLPIVFPLLPSRPSFVCPQCLWLEQAEVSIITLVILVSLSVYSIECETRKGKETCKGRLSLYLQGLGWSWGGTSERINMDYAMLMVKAKHRIRSLTSKRKIYLLIPHEKEKFPSRNWK